LKLITRFSTKHGFLSGDELVELEASSLTPRLIIGRDQSRYAGIDFSHVPKNKRQQALIHQLTALSMWQETAHCVAWQGGFAQLWFWDASQIRRIQKAHKNHGLTRLRSPLYLAEAVYWQKPAAAGVYLCHCHSGFDLQNWQNGYLVASQWFRRSPEQTQIKRFARSQGLADASAQSLVPVTELLPWPGVVRPLKTYWLERKQQLAIAFCSAVVFLMSLQLIAIAQWSATENDIQHEITKLESSAKNLLAARGKARRASVASGNIVQLFDMPDTLASQWAVLQRIPSELNLSLKKWQRNIDSVEIIVEGQIVDTLSLVKALNKKGITAAKVEPSRINGQYNIALTIQPQAITAVKKEAVL
jgi:hypothetical protein